jgi:hypothetical protein
MALTVQEFATKAKKHPVTVRKWCRLGVVKAKKIGARDWLIYEDPSKY